MIFTRITSRGLAQHSYFIGSAATAAVIDPHRCNVHGSMRAWTATRSPVTRDERIECAELENI